MKIHLCSSNTSPWLHVSESALPLIRALLAHNSNLQKWPFISDQYKGHAAASQSEAAAAAGLREAPHPVGNTGITSISDSPGS